MFCFDRYSIRLLFRLNAFLEGFYDIIPMRLISIFNEQELELLISGLPNVDIDDLKANTEYHKYQANSLQVSKIYLLCKCYIMYIFPLLLAFKCTAIDLDQSCICFSIKFNVWHII